MAAVSEGAAAIRLVERPVSSGVQNDKGLSVKRWIPIGAVALLAILLVGGGVWWMLGRSGSPRAPLAPVHSVAIGDDDLQFHFSTVTIHGISGGKVVWKVQAQHFDQMKDRPVIRVTGLKQVFVEGGGHQPLTMTADALEQNTVSGDINLNGSVIVTGEQLVMRTPMAIWSGYREVLQFPNQFAAQLGDYTITTNAPVTYDGYSGQITCTGAVTLATHGNTLQANSLIVNVRTRSVDIGGPATADFNVADLESWANGKLLPAIPRIPEAIEKRYQADKAKQERIPAAKPATPAPHRKGVHP